jgi:hypothetical protein
MIIFHLKKKRENLKKINDFSNKKIFFLFKFRKNSLHYFYIMSRI